MDDVPVDETADTRIEPVLPWIAAFDGVEPIARRHGGNWTATAGASEEVIE
jgi:hypothetical protein